MEKVSELQRTLEQALRDAQETELGLEGAKIEAMDSAGGVRVDMLKEFAQERGKTLTLVNMPERAADFQSFFSVRPFLSVKEQKRKGMGERVGERAVGAYRSLVDVLVLISDVFYGSARYLFGRSGARKGALVDQAVLIGSQALP
ncbi:MAG: hypothetical protein V1800_09165, partial [Candidatus Latescibacterota bacterium]